MYLVDIVNSVVAMVHAKRAGALSLKIQCHSPLTYIAGMFFVSWNRKNQWQERIPNQRECVQNWREHILRSEKQNFGENSGVQKVRNRNNRGITRNSK